MLQKLTTSAVSSLLNVIRLKTTIKVQVINNVPATSLNCNVNISRSTRPLSEIVINKMLASKKMLVGERICNCVDSNTTKSSENVLGEENIKQKILSE